jgi:hypothetical protein
LQRWLENSLTKQVKEKDISDDGASSQLKAEQENKKPHLTLCNLDNQEGTNLRIPKNNRTPYLE